MGGRGSGRKSNWAELKTTDHYRQLDVRWLKREGALELGQVKIIQWFYRNGKLGEISVAAVSDAVILTYRVRKHGEDWKDISCTVRLTTTPGTNGGQRIWFLCPANGCNRRVAKLYGGVIFACRHCHGLVYESQHEDALDRLRRRAGKVRKRLGQPDDIRKAAYFHKRKGMHWTTYEDLCNEHRRLECLINQMFIEQSRHILGSD